MRRNATTIGITRNHGMRQTDSGIGRQRVREEKKDKAAFGHQEMSQTAAKTRAGARRKMTAAAATCAKEKGEGLPSCNLCTG